MKLGFIGLGIMGAPMAGHLLAGGHEVFAFSRSGVPAGVVAQGAQACASPAEVAQKADIIFTMVPDTPHVADVLFGDKGIAQGLSAGKTVVDMSSISPIATKEFAAKINALGCDYLDAPVSGGEVGDKAASLTIMAHGLDVERHDDLVGHLAGLAAAVVADQGDVLAHQRKQGLHCVEGCLRAAHHDGQAGRFGAHFAARHRRVQVVATERIDLGCELFGGDR